MLILVVLLVALLAFIPVGTKLLETARKQVKLQANANAQAVNVARAGLVDAEAWFRLQTQQPVCQRSMAYPDAAFYPRYSTGTFTDTEDESIGLVKTFKLGESNNLYGRYEVVRQSTNNVTTPSANNPHAVHDISNIRISGAAAGSGLVWSIESVGYVYQRKNASVAYNVAPNVLVGRARVSMELKRMGLTTFQSCVAITNRANGSIGGTNCRLTGNPGGYCVAYNAGSGGTWNGMTSSLGNFAPVVSTAITMANVFGLTAYEMRMMSDFNVTSLSQLPTDYPSSSIVYVEGAATFDASRPLSGGGVLVVNGNLTIQSTSNAFFSGVIFVNGNATIYGPAYISGTVIVTGNLTMDGSAGAAEIQYDQTIISAVSTNLGQYRQNKSTYHIFSALE
jgi:hypothetical protein